MKFLDFVAAGQSRGAIAVLMTLMATVLGASATLGVAARAESLGFPAAWWLLSGAIGLLLQGALLSARIRETGARTLPELALLTVGPCAQRLVAAVIAIAWPGVVAAQFVAFAGIFNAFAGTESATLPVIACAGAVIAYTVAGGQMSVVRTDAWQLLVLAVGLGGLFLWVFTGRCGGEPVDCASVRLLSAEFGAREAALSILTVGGAYFLGPDIASRSLVARDGRTARRAVLWAAPVLALIGVAIALCGMWAAKNAPGAGNPLVRTAAMLPWPLRLCLAAGLAAAVLSSADTCLVNVSAIVTNDLLRVRSVAATRVAVVAIGAASTALALCGGDIIGILLKSYSVYTPGIVCPLALAVVAGHARKGTWLAAVAAGGLCGLASAVVPGAPEWLPAAGMALSLALAAV